MSRKPGIGFVYTNTHKQWHKNGLRSYTRSNGFYGGLPRYLKDKIFDQYERQRISITNKRKAEEQYLKKLDELAQHHSDPALYYEQCMQQAHDKIAADSKSKEKI